MALLECIYKNKAPLHKHIKQVIGQKNQLQPSNAKSAFLPKNCHEKVGNSLKNCAPPRPQHTNEKRKREEKIMQQTKNTQISKSCCTHT